MRRPKESAAACFMPGFVLGLISAILLVAFDRSIQEQPESDFRAITPRQAAEEIEIHFDPLRNPQRVERTGD